MTRNAILGETERLLESRSSGPCAETGLSLTLSLIHQKQGSGKWWLNEELEGDKTMFFAYLFAHAGRDNTILGDPGAESGERESLNGRRKRRMFSSPVHTFPRPPPSAPGFPRMGQYISLNSL